MRYNLGNYRYENGGILVRKRFLKIFHYYSCIDSGPYSYLDGVRRVNSICGIVEEQ